MDFTGYAPHDIPISEETRKPQLRSPAPSAGALLPTRWPTAMVLKPHWLGSHSAAMAVKHTVNIQMFWQKEAWEIHIWISFKIFNHIKTILQLSFKISYFLLKQHEASSSDS